MARSLGSALLLFALLSFVTSTGSHGSAPTGTPHIPGTAAATDVLVLKQLTAGDYSSISSLNPKLSALPPCTSAGRSVRCFDVSFESHRWRGRIVQIHGFYGFPDRTVGRLPALLLVHGGGGHAELDSVIEAAGKGFATLAIDLPGKGWRRPESLSTGPDMTVAGLFWAREPLLDNYIYHAVMSQMRAITFLTSRPEVDPSRIGLLGVSWAGLPGS